MHHDTAEAGPNFHTSLEKNFIWCGAQICEQRDANNNVTKPFFSEAEQIGANAYYFFRDHLGKVTEMLDSSFSCSPLAGFNR